MRSTHPNQCPTRAYRITAASGVSPVEAGFGLVQAEHSLASAQTVITLAENLPPGSKVKITTE